MILLRTLRNDYAKYTRDDDDLESLERDISEESGWKLVHGDVFRAPRHLWLLSALLGTGVQLAMLALSTILITIAGQPGWSLIDVSEHIRGAGHSCPRQQPQHHGLGMPWLSVVVVGATCAVGFGSQSLLRQHYLDHCCSSACLSSGVIAELIC